jgi:hypothetical protein
MYFFMIENLLGLYGEARFILDDLIFFFNICIL